MRGYAYRSIGVDLGGDEVVGGRSLLEGSAELRVRVSPSIGVVAFVDAGYVDPNSWPSFNGDVKIGGGGGLRYYPGWGRSASTSRCRSSPRKMTRASPFMSE